jgi:hypothetical protein
MFEMFEVYGRQITAFITEAKTLLEALRIQGEANIQECVEIRTQLTRVEVALAAFDIDDDEEEEAPTEIAAEVAEEVATEVAEEIAAEVAVETVVEGVPEVQETIPPAVVEEVPVVEGETPLPETPVPDEPAAEPEQLPTQKRQRTWI